MRHKNGPAPAASTAIEVLSVRLAAWRKTHKAPSPLPTELWAEAVELAGRLGVGPTARALRLDYASLKRRVQEARGQQLEVLPLAPAVSESPAATFMQWLMPQTPVSDTIAECALEVESSRGGRLRIQMKNLAPGGLATILREFAG